MVFLKQSFLSLKDNNQIRNFHLKLDSNYIGINTKNMYILKELITYF